MLAEIEDITTSRKYLKYTFKKNSYTRRKDNHTFEKLQIYTNLFTPDEETGVIRSTCNFIIRLFLLHSVTVSLDFHMSAFS